MYKRQHVARPCDKAIAGFEEVKPMVFAGVYPIEAEEFEDLRASLEKLQLNGYNRARQAAITQEITEVCAGARAQNQKRK